ncbi:hypothetical protein CB0940_06363 [Cercospora beticola]|uniref:F-box domain-containing protein n=1 Tax=Cercospora beticola TaxID=122368 RepID=A0A2G5HYW4_CERBT|nr:hypothetical protein CB0940_06363 [Cercospora beticola]PIA97483.1 hypothetical protein CB0940_06363 [Cercospora beticola]WPA98991.1 hypothetical protein RHO25_003605 [Cercospora beticola]CAK1360296.1 unnamed protein product [Cercospora beticola]
MTDPNANNGTPTSLLDLPPELKLKVLSNLSAKEVQLARSICTELRDVIDEPRNRILILNPIRARAEARITEQLHPLLDFPCTLNLRDFIFSYLIRRGVWEHPLQNSLLVNSAAAQWAKFKLMEKGEDSPYMSAEGIGNVLGWIGMLFLHAHNRTYYSELTTTLSDDDINASDARSKYFAALRTVMMPRVDTLEDFFDHLDLPFGTTLEGLKELGLPLDREELGASYLEIVQKRLYGSSTPIPRAPSPRLAMPPHILTPLVHFDQSTDDLLFRGEPAEMKRAGCCTATQIAEIHGTDSVRELGDMFGYCLKTDWAMKRFSAALEGRVLTEWEKAAVLEDLYVF